MGSHKHYIDVDKTFKNGDRIDFFKPFIEGKNVLHIGYADWPKTRVHKNLHLKISPLCKRLDGLDYNIAEELRVSNGELYSSFDQISNIYDTILIPEVIEHVDNVREFLETLDKFNGTLIITAPDAYLLYNTNFKELDNGQFYELVHSDHNCWYSPFTLMNTINKYSKKRKVISLHWLMNQSIAAVCK